MDHLYLIGGTCYAALWCICCGAFSAAQLANGKDAEDIVLTGTLLLVIGATTALMWPFSCLVLLGALLYKAQAIFLANKARKEAIKAAAEKEMAKYYKMVDDYVAGKLKEL